MVMAKNAGQTLFTHAFMQNLALIFAHKRGQIKEMHPSLYDQILLTIKEKIRSLEYTSPFILKELHDCTKQKDENGQLTGLSENKAMEKLGNAVKHVMTQ